MQRVLSGIQPTGTIHLGNYLGAIKNWVAFQETHEALFCIVDLHALTSGYPEVHDLKQHVRLMASCYIACGINPAKSAIFVQSQVPAHCELSWLLSCLTPLGWLNRMTQFKDKAGTHKESASLGLYAYPVLMAADVLVYQATHVPVGDDQKQHLELARDIAGAFNRQVAQDFFPLPEPCILGPAPRVMSLRDGTAKMSKSDPSDFARLNLLDDVDTLSLKIRKAKTDSLPIPDNGKELEGREEAKNLFSIYAALTNQTVDQALQGFAGQNFAPFKAALADVVVNALAPLGKEVQRLMLDVQHIDAILKQGAERAKVLSNETMRKVRDLIGLL